MTDGRNTTGAGEAAIPAGAVTAASSAFAKIYFAKGAALARK